MGIKLVKDLVTPSLTKIENNLEGIPRKALDFFVKQTPKDTGNARRKTRLQGNKTILAGYDYATELDKGTSTQAPKGMTKPTKEYIDRLIRLGVRK